MVEAGLAKSTSEAIRLIEQGGVRRDGERVKEVTIEILLSSTSIQVGQRKFKKIIFVE